MENSKKKFSFCPYVPAVWFPFTNTNSVVRFLDVFPKMCILLSLCLPQMVAYYLLLFCFVFTYLGHNCIQIQIKFPSPCFSPLLPTSPLLFFKVHNISLYHNLIDQSPVNRHLGVFLTFYYWEHTLINILVNSNRIAISKGIG